MTTVTGSDLGLGVIFTGKVDQSFKRAVSKLRSSILELGNLQKRFSAAQAQKSHMASGGSELTDFSKELGKATNQTQKYQTALASLGDTHGKTGIAFQQQKKSLDATERSIQNYASSLRNTSKWQSNAKVIADRFNKSVDREAIMRMKSAVASQKVASAQKTVQAATKKTTTTTKAATEQYQGLSKQLSRVHGGMARVQAAFKVTASYGLASAAIYSVVTALKSGASEIINFDQALKNLEAISGGTNAQIEAMKGTIEDIANTTKFSTTEIAEGMVLLTQAGLSAEEAIGAMQATANLATGTLSNMQTTADLMTTSIRAFGLAAQESGRVSDVMANAINKSKLTVDKLRISFNFVGAAAAQTGLSIEETAASMSVLANNGLRASTIGTGLRQALARLLAPNRKLRDAFKSHSIALDEVNPRLVGFQKAFKTLAPLLLDQERGVIDMGKAYQLFGLRGAQAAAILSRSFLDGKFDEMYTKINKVGTAEEMMGIQAEGLAVKIKNLADKAGLLAIAIGDAGVAGAIVFFIDTLREAVAAATEFAKSMGGELVVSIGAYTVAVYAALKASSALLMLLQGSLFLKLHNLVTVFYILARSVGQFRAALIILGTTIRAHPILFFATVLGTVVSSFYLLNKAFDRNIKKIQQHVIESKRIIGSLEVYQGALKNLQERLEKGEEVGDEYDSMVKRLINDHPELATMVDLTTASYKEMTEAMKEAHKLKTEDFLAQQAEIIKEYRPEVESLNKQLQNFNKLSKEGREYNKPFLEPVANRHKEALSKLNATETSYILTLRDKVAAEKMTLAQAKAQIESNFRIGDSADYMHNKLINSLKAYENQKKVGILSGNETKKALTDREQAALDRIKMLHAKEQGELAKNEAAKEAILKKSQSDLETKHIGEEYSLKEKQIRQDIAKDMDEIAARNLATAGHEIAAIEKKIEALEKEKVVIDALNFDFDEDKEKALAENEAQILEQKRKLTETHYKNRLATVKKYSDEHLIIMEAMYASKYLSVQEWQDYLKDRAKYEVDVATGMYDRKLISAEEYLAKLKVLHDQGGITDVEFNDAKIEKTGSAFEKLTLGLDRAAAKSKTFSDTMLQVGEDLPVEITNNLTDGLFDYVDGTKSAKEAMKDFAKNTLKWLAEMIIKQQIYNALMGSDGKGGLVNWAVSGIGKALGFADGGWIQEPVVGVGMNSGRPYTFAERGSEYVSPNGAVSQQSSAPPSIQIDIVNKTDSKMESKGTDAQFDGKRWVCSAILEATSNNTGGFKNNMKTALAR